jgi:hypothetical protein
MGEVVVNRVNLRWLMLFCCLRKGCKCLLLGLAAATALGPHHVSVTAPRFAVACATLPYDGKAVPRALHHLGTTRVWRASFHSCPCLPFVLFISPELLLIPPFSFSLLYSIFSSDQSHHVFKHYCSAKRQHCSCLERGRRWTFVHDSDVGSTPLYSLHALSLTIP